MELFWEQGSRVVEFKKRGKNERLLVERAFEESLRGRGGQAFSLDDELSIPEIVGKRKEDAILYEKL